MGASRALITVRAGVTYFNGRDLAMIYTKEIAAKQVVQVPDEIAQRAAVVEAGMRVSACIGSSTTPLKAAISAFRQLNATVNLAKHGDVSPSASATSTATPAFAASTACSAVAAPPSPASPLAGRGCENVCSNEREKMREAIAVRGDWRALPSAAWSVVYRKFDSGTTVTDPSPTHVCPRWEELMSQFSEAVDLRNNDMAELRSTVAALQSKARELPPSARASAMKEAWTMEDNMNKAEAEMMTKAKLIEDVIRELAKDGRENEAARTRLVSITQRMCQHQRLRAPRPTTKGKQAHGHTKKQGKRF